MPAQPKTFLSYARKDSEFALKLAKDLKRAGADVWVDQLNIVPGKLWDLAIQEAVADCPRMLVILSPTSVQSKNVMDEVSFALEEEKDVIPVIYLTCKVPFRLRRLQYVDLTNDYGGGVTRLLETLGVKTKDMPLISTQENPPSSEHLHVLQKAIETRDISIWNQWRKDNPNIILNLRGADLREAYLRGAHLILADLSGADLSGADLRGAYLRGAGLRGADLSGADLSGAHLTVANLRKADLSRANLSRANLHGANLSEAEGLSQEQINEANGDKDTQLPVDLHRPAHWEKSAQSESQSEHGK